MIKIYTTNTCTRCGQLKKIFDKKGIEYVICQDRDEMISLGIKSVPVVSHNGKLYNYEESLENIVKFKKVNGRQLMSEAKFYEGYSRYIDEEGRYETWQESVARVMKMHRVFYKDKMTDGLEKLINEAEQGYADKLFLGAQRALQFGGEQLLAHHSRLYNCSASHCDRPDFFGGLFYLLLSGAGVGFSVQKQHISKLPNIEKRDKGTASYTVDDSIEGWASTIDVLLSSYFENGGKHPEYKGKNIHFDLSNIRPKGAFISGGFKAPGSEPLRKALDIVERLIEDELSKGVKVLRTIVAYDICMYIADAVISGGVRRSATICLFSKDDEEMLNAKTGDWFINNPQRGRSNNSVALLRSDTTKEEFDHIMKSVKDFGEPGFIFTDNLEFVYNPCFTGDMKLLTENGYKTFEELDGNRVNVVNKDGNISNGKVWCNGEKETIELTLRNGNKIKCTPNHVFMLNDGTECKAKDTVGKRLMPYKNVENNTNAMFVKLGFIQGDGCTGRLKSKDHKGIDINIGKNDRDIAELFNIDYCDNKRVYYTEGYNDLLLKLGFNTNKLPERILPNTYDKWNREDKLSFLKGCYSANGSIIKKYRISYKTTCRDFAEQLKNTLFEFNISSNITTNKSKKVLFSNGEYQCKESYDININRLTDIIKFYELIGFVQIYKTENLLKLIKDKSPLVRSIKSNGLQKVYDFSEPLVHWGVVEGVVAHNCVEVGMLPVTEDNRGGFQACNLTEINGAKSNTKEVFFQQCKLASIVGTLQAGYTNFKFLTDATKEIIEREALIGVGITGMMNNPNILFNDDIQREGARIVKHWNKVVAKMIGINQASRTTVIKPSGNSAVILGCASGVHGEHSESYLRHVQFNKDTEVAQMFMRDNPDMCEDSVWSRERDVVVAFPIDTPKGSILKKDLLGIKQLEYVKQTQQAWIEEGTNVGLCRDEKLRHNVSNTITVDDWSEVGDYIYNNRNYLCGVSLLSSVGDRAYPQAPFTEVLTMEQITERYGEISMFTSALIEAGLGAFNGDLWTACSTSMGFGEKLSVDNHNDLMKRDFVRRFNKFATNFTSTEECSNCLKDVYNLHKLWRINKKLNNIDWIKELSKKEYIDIDTMGAIACGGGKCDV